MGGVFWVWCWFSCERKCDEKGVGRRKGAQGPRRPGSRPSRRSRRARSQQTLSLFPDGTFEYGREEAVVTSGYGGEETAEREWTERVQGECVRYLGGEYEELDDLEEIEAGGSLLLSSFPSMTSPDSFHCPPRFAPSQWFPFCSISSEYFPRSS